MSTPQNPFVIQCSYCKQVVADSFSLLDFRANKLVLHSVSSYTSLSKTKIAGGTDGRCIFYNVLCNCGAEIGKKYIATDEEAQVFLGKYCLEGDKVIVYRLGVAVDNKIPTLSEFVEEVLKLQRFCSYIYQRVEELDLRIAKNGQPKNKLADFSKNRRKNIIYDENFLSDDEAD